MKMPKYFLDKIAGYYMEMYEKWSKDSDNGFYKGK